MAIYVIIADASYWPRQATAIPGRLMTISDTMVTRATGKMAGDIIMNGDTLVVYALSVIDTTL